MTRQSFKPIPGDVIVEPGRPVSASAAARMIAEEV